MVGKLGIYNKNEINIYDFSTIVFDLDNTLYDEIEYLKFAYNDIANKIIKLTPKLSKHKVYEFLINTFLSEDRKLLYQKLIYEFNISNFKIEDFLYSLRCVVIPPNSIEIKGDFCSFINNEIENFNFFIATNGNPIQQKNKIRSLNIPFKNTFNIIYCDLLGKEGKKPSGAFFDVIINVYNIKRNEILFIGDSIVDKLSAANGKIKFLYVNQFENLIRNF